MTHREIMTELIEDFVKENLKHFDTCKINCLEVSKWNDIIRLGEEKNHRNICHAIDAVRIPVKATCGTDESTTYTKVFMNKIIELRSKG